MVESKAMEFAAIIISLLSAAGCILWGFLMESKVEALARENRLLAKKARRQIRELRKLHVEIKRERDIEEVVERSIELNRPFLVGGMDVLTRAGLGNLETESDARQVISRLSKRIKLSPLGDFHERIFQLGVRRVAQAYRPTHGYNLDRFDEFLRSLEQQSEDKATASATHNGAQNSEPAQ